MSELISALEAGKVRPAEPDIDAPGVGVPTHGSRPASCSASGSRDCGSGATAASSPARDRAAFGLLDVLDGPAARGGRSRGRAVAGRARRIHGPIRRPPGAGRRGHAPVLPERRGLGRPGLNGRLARLVGSCAQVGERVHLSARRRWAAFSSPPAPPVIVEDDAFVGGGCGLYEGVVVGRGAVSVRA